MPHFAIRIQVLHIQFDDVGGLERLAGLERSLDDPTRLQVPNSDPIKSLTLAGFYELVFNNRAWVPINDDL